MTFNFERYRHFFDDCDYTEDQARELALHLYNAAGLIVATVRAQTRRGKSEAVETNYLQDEHRLMQNAKNTLENKFNEEANY